VLNSAQQPSGQEDKSGHQIQRAMHSDADNAERKKHQPDKRIGDQRKKGQRPAEDEEQTPKKGT